MSKRARRQAADLATVIVRDLGADTRAISRLLLPVVLQADMARVMQKELRAHARRREQLIRQAVSPPKPPAGYAALTPGRFVTTLAQPPAAKPVNGSSGHDAAFDPSLWRADQ